MVAPHGLTTATTAPTASKGSSTSSPPHHTVTDNILQKEDYFKNFASIRKKDTPYYTNTLQIQNIDASSPLWSVPGVRDQVIDLDEHSMDYESDVDHETVFEMDL
jgi:hypothetical protein